MKRHIVLLRGVNLVSRNRVSMPQLRAALEEQGYRDVRTYVQSGNVVLSSQAAPERVAGDVSRLIKLHFQLEITVIVRSRAQLASVVRRNPLSAVAKNHRRYLVTFLSGALPRAARAELDKVATKERFQVIGREIYSWHPDGIGRTPLWERLASKSLGVGATSRNWATVTRLLAMASETTSR